MPVARYSACEIALHRCEQAVVAVREVVPVSATVPVFPSGTHGHYSSIKEVVSYKGFALRAASTAHYARARKSATKREGGRKKKRPLIWCI